MSQSTEHSDTPSAAELQAENDLLWDDLARVLAERNAVAEIAAAYALPGPDGQDDLDRRELIASWLDEARDRVDDEPRSSVRPLWLAPETQAMRDMTRKELRVRLRRGLRIVRDQKQRTAEVAEQRDQARRALVRIQEMWGEFRALGVVTTQGPQTDG